MARNWRNSRQYRYWRAIVIRRDRRCQVCGSIKNRHAHHLNHAQYFPDQRYDVDNGLCLCRECHQIYHNRFIGGTRKKCTKSDYDRFLELKSYLQQLIDS